MNLTKDNYKEFLDSTKLRMDTIPHFKIAEVQKEFDKIRQNIQKYRIDADDLISNNKILKIGVVGQVKAGKSSFLNSLIFGGENVLPRAATPMTAGLTILEYAEENEFEAEFYSNAEWQTFVDRAEEFDKIISDNKAVDPAATVDDIVRDLNLPDEYQAAKELVMSCGGKASQCLGKESKKHIEKFNDITDMQSILEDYVGADGVYTPVVKCLTIRMNDERLKDMQIVDTPGVNDPVVSREERTRQFLKSCHGVFFLSYAGRFFDSTDVQFLVDRVSGNGIGTVVVIASKYDSVLQDAGGKFHDDLAGALEYCEKALKKQLNNNLANSDFKGTRPLFDFSSGIGYSIARKGEKRWDSTEKHVVSQMKRFYPSFFTNEDEIKEVFMDLSQIEEIHDKYLDNTFGRNKEKVINEKMSAFFLEMGKSLNKNIDNALKEVSGMLKELSESKVGNLQARRKSADKALRSLEGEINRFSEDVKSNVKNNAVKLINKTSLSGVKLSTRTESRTFVRSSTFWGRDKSFTCTVTTVDLSKTKENVSSSLEKEFNQIVDSWEKIVMDAMDLLKKKMDGIITKHEQNDSEGLLDVDRLRDIVSDILTSFGSLQTFSISEMRNKSLMNLNEQLQCIKELSSRVGKCEESEAQEMVRNKAREKVSQASNSLDDWKYSVIQEISSKIDEISKKLINELSQNKSKIVDEIRDRMNAYLSQLDNELKNAEANKALYLEAERNLKEIKSTQVSDLG